MLFQPLPGKNFISKFKTAQLSTWIVFKSAAAPSGSSSWSSKKSPPVHANTLSLHLLQQGTFCARLFLFASLDSRHFLDKNYSLDLSAIASLTLWLLP